MFFFEDNRASAIENKAISLLSNWIGGLIAIYKILIFISSYSPAVPQQEPVCLRLLLRFPPS